jgi:hypothetical protein
LLRSRVGGSKYSGSTVDSGSARGREEAGAEEGKEEGKEKSSKKESQEKAGKEKSRKETGEEKGSEKGRKKESRKKEEKSDEEEKEITAEQIQGLIFRRASEIDVFRKPVFFQRMKLAGSLIGGIRETQEMLDFCAAHGVVSDVEVIPIQKINEAYERVVKSDIRNRFVIDMANLKS